MACGSVIRSAYHAVVVTSVLCLCILEVYGITTQGNPDNPKFVVQPTDYPYFVSLQSRGDCAGTIIGQQHVVTAAHCLCGAGSNIKTILFNNSVVSPITAYFNPDCMFDCEDDGPNRCDVAVMEYEKAIVGASVPLAVYRWSDEVSKKVTILGYGNTGDAADGKCEEGDGKLRRAENLVTAVEGSPGGVIKYVMDPYGLDLEGMAQDGDSGGPLVINRDGIDYVAGANSGTSESNPCDFHSVDQYCRLSAHYGFISKVLDPSDNSISPAMDFSFTSGSRCSATLLAWKIFVMTAIFVVLGYC